MLKRPGKLVARHGPKTAKPTDEIRVQRQLGADYLYAQVTRNQGALAALNAQYEPETILDALAITSESLAGHVAELEGTTAGIIACAYRDTWALMDAAARTITLPGCGSGQIPPQPLRG